MPGRVAVTIALLLNGLGSAAAEIPAKDRRSGFDLMSPQTQAMQADDTSNPGMFAVIEGERLWKEPQGTDGKSCASCHRDAEQSMRGVAARYPAFDEATQRPIDLAGRINRCREKQQSTPSLARESDELLAVTTRAFNHFVTKAAAGSNRNSGSCSSPVRPATTIAGVRDSAVVSFLRGILRAIPCIDSNGSHSGLCSDAFAGVSSASGQSLSSTVLRSTSTSSCFLCRARRD
jgi:hypothetical protein